ncbi:MAG TPA: MaoC family dehydratase N-terminal domain-containing protein [Allosphingosinicella sp.]|jgi:hypothetical protein
MESSAQFGAAVSEFLVKTRELIGEESVEDVPPRIGGREPPGPLVPSIFRLDEDNIRRYAWTIGDDNPLFTDPAYGQAGLYRSQIAPGPILVHCRYPADHGASREHGYPVANFLGGLSWEFFDVVRPGTAVSTSKTLREVLEPRGLRGERIILLVCEVIYYDSFRRPLAKAYGTLVQVPMKNMGTSRSMPLHCVDEDQLYDREPHRYAAEEVAAIEAGMAKERRRGAAPLYWEDVEVGEALPPIFQPPYAIPDALSYQSLHQGLVRGFDGRHLARSFTPAFKALKAGWGYPDYARTHPVTRWPHTPGDEHEDALLCGFRGQPLPFDFGIQRAQVPQRLLGNWAGDSGFCRKMSMSMGRPVFHGDALVMRGSVVGKKLLEEGEPRRRCHAVTIAMEAASQRGEIVSRGFATVYLPSRSDGDPRLPVVPAEIPYVPYDRHRSREWF